MQWCHVCPCANYLMTTAGPSFKHILSVCRFFSFMHLCTCAAVVYHFLWRRWWPSPDVQLYQCDLRNRRTHTGTGEQTGRKRGVHQTAHVQTWRLMHCSHFVAMSDVIYVVVFVLLLMWNRVLSWDARHISQEYFYHDHCTFKLTDSVDVLHSAGGEVVVQHEVDSFEVDSSGEQSRADQHPNLTRAKTAHYVVPLKQNKTATGEEDKYKVALQKRTQYTVCSVSVWTCCCVRSAWITSTLMPSYTSSWKSSRARSIDCTNTSMGGRKPWKQRRGQPLVITVLPYTSF